jgi:hypothetical protein
VKKLLLIAAAVLLLPLSLLGQGKEQRITYAGNSAVIATNVAASNFNNVSGTYLFLMAVNPNQNASIFVRSYNGSACTLQFEVFTTAQSQISSFIQEEQPWLNISLQHNGNTLSSTQQVAIGGGATNIINSATLQGTQAAFQITVISGCTTQFVDVNVIFNTIASISTTSGGGGGGSEDVQGTTATGASGVAVNPVVDGGLDASGLVKPFGVIDNSGVSIENGISIGRANVGTGATSSTMATVSSAGQPLAVLPFALRGGGTLAEAQTKQDIARSAGPRGMYVKDSGYEQTLSNGAEAAGTFTFPAWGNNLAGGNSLFYSGPLQYCRVDADISSTAGAGDTVTVDIYLQDSPDNTNFTDRMHLATFSNATSGTVDKRFWQSLAVGTTTGGSTNTYESLSLASGSTIDGPLSFYGQFVMVIAVTGPAGANSATINSLSAVCR